MSGKIDEKHWSWIVPVVIFIMIVCGLFFGCSPSRANAVEPSPSPEPHVSADGNPGVVIAIIVVTVIASAVMWRNMKKHAND